MANNIKKLPDHILPHRMVSNEDGIIVFEEVGSIQERSDIIDIFEEGVYHHFKELPLEKLGANFSTKEKRSTQYDYEVGGKPSQANAYMGLATTNAVSVCDGKIVGIETGEIGRNKIWVQSDNGLRIYLYETLRNRPRFKEGDTVNAGDRLGLIGTPDYPKLIFKVFKRDRFKQAVDLKSQIIQKAKEHGLPEQIALATAEIESRFNPNAGGHGKAYGLMGIMSKYAAGFDDRFTDSDIKGNQKKLYDVDLNLTIGVKKLKALWDRYGNLCDLRCAYYSGGSFSTVEQSHKDKSKGGMMPNEKQTTTHIIDKTIPRMFNYTREFEKEYNIKPFAKRFANKEQKAEYEKLSKKTIKEA